MHKAKQNPVKLRPCLTLQSTLEWRKCIWSQGHGNGIWATMWKTPGCQWKSLRFRLCESRVLCCHIHWYISRVYNGWMSYVEDLQQLWAKRPHSKEEALSIQLLGSNSVRSSGSASRRQRSRAERLDRQHRTGSYWATRETPAAQHSGDSLTLTWK